jgi:hypothetical protein
VFVIAFGQRDASDLYPTVAKYAALHVCIDIHQATAPNTHAQKSIGPVYYTYMLADK